jgi:DNA-binding response OmpR family regulator
MARPLGSNTLTVPHMYDSANSRSDSPVMPRILIVDDDQDTCFVMRRVFAKWNWASHCVTDSRQAHDAVRTFRPDAVLLDIGKPHLDGFAVLEALRADQDLAATPVLFHSAQTDGQTCERALAAGADDFIPKGISAKQIRERISLYVQEPVASPSTPDIR